MFEICVEAPLDAAHQVRLADGTLEPLHRHDWRIRVAVGRADLDEQAWVCDFDVLRGLLAEVLEPLQGADLSEALTANPTAESLAAYVAGRIRPRLPEAVHLCYVEVQEAAGCVARYRPEGFS